MTQEHIAMDFLIAAKSGVRNYAMAVTEAGTPEIKATLARHLEEALDMHERITAYLMEKGLTLAPGRVSFCFASGGLFIVGGDAAGLFFQGAALHV